MNYRREDLNQFVPFESTRTCACCILYDWHPTDDKRIDITICSHEGVVQEFYENKVLCSVKIENATNFRQIRILRNNKGELFYLVAAKDEIIIILSRKEKLVIHRRENAQSYEIVDPECLGEAKLKLVTKTSEVIHLSISNYFENICDTRVNNEYEVTKPVICLIQQKLIQGKFNLQSNEIAYSNISNLRQLAIQPHSSQDLGTVEIKAPIRVLCNKKIVILTRIENTCPVSITNVWSFINTSSCDSIAYTSKIFKILSSSPFYEEIENQEIVSNSSVFIATVIPIKQFKFSTNHEMKFTVAVSYCINKNDNNRDIFQCEKNVSISASDVMGNDFDEFDGKKNILFNPENPAALGTMALAILSATEKTTLCIQQIVFDNDRIMPSDIFHRYLNMEFSENNNMAIFKQEPYHILFGIMLIFHDIPIEQSKHNFKIDVYARSPSQVLALIHHIYENIPHKLIVTSPNIQMKVSPHKANLDYKQYKDSLHKQATMTLQYLEQCIKQMQLTRHSDQSDTLLCQTDILAMGIEKFAEYRNNMLLEVDTSVKH